MCVSKRDMKVIFDILRGREIVIVCMMNGKGEPVCVSERAMRVTFNILREIEYDIVCDSVN